jgi:FdhD protein
VTTSTKSIEIKRLESGGVQNASDVVSIEEPLEIRLLQGVETQSISVTMRTPGHDQELAVGFLLTEGIIRQRADVVTVSLIDPNVIVVELDGSVKVDLKPLSRNFYTTSSCGVCGKTSIEAVWIRHTINVTQGETSPAILTRLPEIARQSQAGFGETGGSHASSLFTLAGDLLLTREDVGRHNALDKVIGHCLMHEIGVSDCILLVSGRASFELVQKAAVAGISVVAAIGAPSSLAIELAIEAGITLVGFLKADRFNIYSHPQRIKS